MFGCWRSRGRGFWGQPQHVSYVNKLMITCYSFSPFVLCIAVSPQQLRQWNHHPLKNQFCGCVVDGSFVVCPVFGWLLLWWRRNLFLSFPLLFCALQLAHSSFGSETTILLRMSFVVALSTALLLCALSSVDCCFGGKGTSFSPLCIAVCPQCSFCSETTILLRVSFLVEWLLALCCLVIHWFIVEFAKICSNSLPPRWEFTPEQYPSCWSLALRRARMQTLHAQSLHRRLPQPTR